MPTLGNTDVLGQNGRGKVNRSRPTHYDICISLHYAWGVYRPTTIDCIQYSARERLIDTVLILQKLLL